LRDRLEVIELPSYTESEKLQIAKRYLVPRQLEEHGLSKQEVKIPDSTLRCLIHDYTREAGVRQLEREVAALTRKATRRIVSNGDFPKPLVLKPDTLKAYLGAPRFVNETAEAIKEYGIATGLAWTPVGGDIMFIETRIYPGKGEVRLTGQMGDVMKESAQAAVSWTRANAARLGIDADKIAAADLHIHLPQGAIKKDGPSAGVALTCAVVSVFTKRPIRNDIAITGEIDLRGNALPVGGIKEKVIAAHRAGIKIVFLPDRNRKDTIDIPDEVKKELDLRYMTKIDDALAVALGDAPPTPDPEPAIPPPTAPTGRGSVGERLPS
jgi:ATP-dependent Lon protease